MSSCKYSVRSCWAPAAGSVVSPIGRENHRAHQQVLLAGSLTTVVRLGPCDLQEALWCSGAESKYQGTPNSEDLMFPWGEVLLCLPEQKHLLGWSGQSCRELPGTEQTVAAFRAHGQVAQRSGSEAMGEGCGFAGHKGVVTEDLGTGLVWWPLEWMG